MSHIRQLIIIFLVNKNMHAKTKATKQGKVTCKQLNNKHFFLAYQTTQAISDLHNKSSADINEKVPITKTAFMRRIKTNYPAHI